MELITKNDWNIYFETLCKKYFNKLKIGLEEQIKISGNPNIVILVNAFLSDISIAFVFGKSEFIKEFTNNFTNAYIMNEKTAVKTALSTIDELKRKHLENYNKERLENHYTIAERKIIWKNLFNKNKPLIDWRPVQNNKPLKINGIYDKLIFENEERKFVKYLVKLVTYQRFKKFIIDNYQSELSKEELKKSVNSVFTHPKHDYCIVKKEKEAEEKQVFSNKAKKIEPSRNDKQVLAEIKVLLTANPRPTKASIVQKIIEKHGKNYGRTTTYKLMKENGL